jgi:hypothetical protein
MKINLTYRQMKFLEKVLEQHETKYRIIIPLSRIRIILKNGCYYDDMNSYTDPPTYVSPNRKQSDKYKLNMMGNKIRRINNANRIG